MIADADAVVNPRAVVVHLNDAPVADAAVVSPRGFEDLAPPALPVPLPPLTLSLVKRLGS